MLSREAKIAALLSILLLLSWSVAGDPSSPRNTLRALNAADGGGLELSEEASRGTFPQKEEAGLQGARTMRVHRDMLDAYFANHRAAIMTSTTYRKKPSSGPAPLRIQLLAEEMSSSSSAGYANVVDFGAVGNGEVDDTAAFTSALNSPLGKGGLVFVPAGTYKIDGTLTIPPYTTLVGVNNFPQVWVAPNARPSTNVGSVLYATYNGTTSGAAGQQPFIFLSTESAGVKGLTIFYPGQNIQNSAPFVFPACIAGSGNNLNVEDMLLVNPYIAIDFASQSCPRHFINNVYGQPLSIGIQVDKIYDIGRIRNCHFWPFWAPAGSPTTNWIGANARTFIFYRSDWEEVEDVFSWGYFIGMVFTNDPNTPGAHSLNGQLTNINFDNVNVGLLFNGTQPYGVMISNLNLANAGNGKAYKGAQTAILCPSTAPSNSVEENKVTIRGASIWGQFNGMLHWNCNGVLLMQESFLQQWTGAEPGVYVANGIVTLQSSYLIPLGVHQGATIVEATDAAIQGFLLTGNVLPASGYTINLNPDSESYKTGNNIKI